MQRPLERAQPPDEGNDDAFHHAARNVEPDEGLPAEMAEWDATVGDDLAYEAAPTQPA